jgi:hypothetical protein
MYGIAAPVLVVSRHKGLSQVIFAQIKDGIEVPGWAEKVCLQLNKN